ncbi:MAG TPA: hypothetical protein VGD37_00850 [Kofleriaceae bacterium]|jgi:hypothetical protein
MWNALPTIERAARAIPDHRAIRAPVHARRDVADMGRPRVRETDRLTESLTGKHCQPLLAERAGAIGAGLSFPPWTMSAI